VLAAAVGVIALTAGLAVWLLVLRDATTPVSVGEAISGFRDDGIPGSGVYVYATSGEESVDALLGSTHAYPAETTITVSTGGCGVLLRWAPVQGRTQTYELCPVEDGFELAGYRETHRFLGQTTGTDYRCEPGSPWLLPGQETFERRCSTEDTTEVARGRIVGRETLTVGEKLEAYVRLVTTSREDVGGERDWWLLPDSGLPARDRPQRQRDRVAIGASATRNRSSFA
jgi:hypothetical protein